MLDCLGTLLRLDPPSSRLRRELSGRGIEVSGGDAATAFRAEISYYVEHHLDGSDAAGLDRLRDACARVVARELGLAPDRLPAVREAMLAALRFSPYPDAAPTLVALRSSGLRLVVASNWDCSLGPVLDGTGLGALVDAVVTSAEVGAAKPHPAVFEAALREAGSRADEAVCVGDSPETDVAGAHAAGLRAILLVRDAPGADARVAGSVPRVRSLDHARSLILAGE